MITRRWIVSVACALLLAPAPARAQGVRVSLLGHQTYGTNVQYSDVHYQNGLAFIGTLTTPGKVFIANAADATLVGTYSTSNSSWVKDLRVQGSYLYVALDAAGIDIVDIANPAAPVFVTRFATSPAGVHDLFVDGPTLYYVDDTSNSKVHIVDVHNPAAPQTIATFTNPGGCHDLTVVGTRAFLANGNSGFQILDVTNPAAPVSLGTQAIAGAYTHNIWPNGDEHYVCTTDETCGSGHLRIWDISNLPTITLVSEYAVSNQGDTCVHNAMWVDDYIYMSYYRWGLRVIDVSNPLAPVEVGDWPTYSGAPGCFVGAWGIWAERASASTTRLHISDISSGLWSFEFANAPNLGSDGVGGYNAATGAFFLKDVNSSGPADTAFTFGTGGAGRVGLAGDWDGNGTETVGLYDGSTSVFFLKNSNDPGGADIAFQFGAPGSGFLPVVGDWDGDGIETVGLYAPSSGTFFLKNTNAPGPADFAFQFGAGGEARPVVGDWDATGTTTVGVYVPSTGAFFLKNSNGSGPADLVFAFGAANSGAVPVAGNWDGVGGDSVGIYAPATSTYFLRNTNGAGQADLAFAFGGSGLTPLGGDWKGPGN